MKNRVFCRKVRTAYLIPKLTVYGQVKTDHRCRMKHATSDRLVYLHEAFHIMQRMQDAGWSADVERWESDSDSSDSDHDGDESDLRMLMV